MWMDTSEASKFISIMKERLSLPHPKKPSDLSDIALASSYANPNLSSSSPQGRVQWCHQKIVKEKVIASRISDKLMPGFLHTFCLFKLWVWTWEQIFIVGGQISFVLIRSLRDKAFPGMLQTASSV